MDINIQLFAIQVNNKFKPQQANHKRKEYTKKRAAGHPPLNNVGDFKGGCPATSLNVRRNIGPCKILVNGTAHIFLDPSVPEVIFFQSCERFIVLAPVYP